MYFLFGPHPFHFICFPSGMRCGSYRVCITIAVHKNTSLLQTVKLKFFFKNFCCRWWVETSRNGLQYGLSSQNSWWKLSSKLSTTPTLFSLSFTSEYKAVQCSYKIIVAVSCKCNHTYEIFGTCIKFGIPSIIP